MPYCGSSGPDAPDVEHLGGGRAGRDAGAGEPLQLAEPAGVVVVHVRVEQQPDVFELEPELADVVANLRHRFRQRAVDQDVPAVRRDEHRAQPARADPVGVAEHLERLLRLVPLRALIRLLRHQGDGDEQPR